MLSIEVDIDGINENIRGEKNQKSLNDTLDDDRDREMNKMTEMSQIEDKNDDIINMNEEEDIGTKIAKRVYVRQFRKGHKNVFGHAWDGNSWV